MRFRAARPILLAVALALAVAPTVLALQAGDPLGVPGSISTPLSPQAPPPPPTPIQPPASHSPGSGAGVGAEPGFADSVRGGLQDALVVAGVTAAAVAGVGLAGFALVTRYITPKEALKNPQRAMLYGFVR